MLWETKMNKDPDWIKTIINLRVSLCCSPRNIWSFFLSLQLICLWRISTRGCRSVQSPNVRVSTSKRGRDRTALYWPGDSTGRVTAVLRLRHGTAVTLPCLHFHQARYGSATCVASRAVPNDYFSNDESSDYFSISRLIYRLILRLI